MDTRGDIEHSITSPCLPVPQSPWLLYMVHCQHLCVSSCSCDPHSLQDFEHVFCVEAALLFRHWKFQTEETCCIAPKKLTENWVENYNRQKIQQMLAFANISGITNRKCNICRCQIKQYCYPKHRHEKENNTINTDLWMNYGSIKHICHGGPLYIQGTLGLNI